MDIDQQYGLVVVDFAVVPFSIHSCCLLNAFVEKKSFVVVVVVVIVSEVNTKSCSPAY